MDMKIAFKMNCVIFSTDFVLEYVFQDGTKGPKNKISSEMWFVDAIINYDSDLLDCIFSK